MQMPLNGDNWQVMRLSRNRNYGHPDMIALIKRLAARVHRDAYWPGILVGDIGQPRGGKRCRVMPAIRSVSMPTSG